MESLRQDVRLGIRLLLKRPAFSLLAISTLALGIGASVALFSVMDAAFIRPLPYANPEQLVDVEVEVPQRTGEAVFLGPSGADVADWQAHGGVFAHIGASRTDPEWLILDGDEPRRLRGERVTRDYFAVYGVAPVIGRDFTPDEYARSARDVAIIGYDLWKTRFNADPAIVGRTIQLNDVPVSIVGVMTESYYRKVHLWRPFDLVADMFMKMRGSGTGTEGRLRAGLSIAEAEAALTAVAARAAAERGGPTGRVKLTSMYQSVTESNVKTARVIAYAVGLVLLLACVNVAGLLLARGAVRRPEMALRSSLGAGRVRLIRQLLTESMLLAVCGTLAGVVLAWWWLDVLVANTPMSLPSNAPVRLDLKVAGFAALTAVATALLFGLVPAWRISGTSVADTLARASRRHGSALSRRGGQAVIGLEVALAIVLMAGAGLMIRSFSRVMAVDLGFDPSASLAIDVSPVTPTHDAHAQYYPALVERLAAHPAIEAAGAVDAVPVIGGGTYARVAANGASHFATIRRYVGAYFDAVGFSLRSGKFPATVSHRGGLPPAVISESAERKLFGGQPALGQTIQVWETTHEIVGVMRDVKYRGPLSTRPLEPEVYVPSTTMFDNRRAPRPLMVIVKQRDGATLPPNFLRETVQSAGQRAVLQEITQGSAWLGQSVVTARRRTVLLGLLGGLGLVLALVGIFGVTAYAVSRRTQEIGVRMAFGASHRSVVGVMIRDSIVPVAVGVGAGLLASWWATKAISSFLFQTEPRDVATLAGVAALLGLSAIVAAWIPARRAARVDPIVALRAE